MPKILLVEDDTNLAQYIATCLESAGHVCTTSAAADTARVRLQTEPDIALVILDHDLGADSESGLALLASLRAAPATRDLPVVICTAESRPHLLRNFLGLRIAGILKKPFRPERLIADVQHALGQAH